MIRLLPVKQLRHCVAVMTSLLLVNGTRLVPVQLGVVSRFLTDAIQKCVGVVRVDDFDLFLLDVSRDKVGIVVDVDHVRDVEVQLPQSHLAGIHVSSL